MTSYTTLVADKDTDGSIKQFVNDSTIPSAIVLTQAQHFIYTRLRVGQMLTTTTGTISSGSTNLALPDRYLSPLSFRITTPDQRTLTSVEPERLWDAIAYTTAGAREEGPPASFARIGTNFEFDYKADQAYTYSLLFYQQPAALSGSNETNFLTDRYLPLLYAACEGYAYDFKKDMEKKQEAMARAEIEISHCNGDWDRERHESQGGIYSLDTSC